MSDTSQGNKPQAVPQVEIQELERSLQQSEAALSKHFEALAKLSRELETERARRDGLREQLDALRSAPDTPAPDQSAPAKTAASQASAATASKPVTPASVAEGPKAAPLEVSEEQRLAQLKHSELVGGSKLFDADWYLATYPDVKSAKKYSQAPHEHYLMYGGFEGRNPGPAFHSAFYLAHYPDVAANKINPLVHYLLHGHKEGRRIDPELVPEQKKA